MSSGDLTGSYQQTGTVGTIRSLQEEAGGDTDTVGVFCWWDTTLRSTTSSYKPTVEPTSCPTNVPKGFRCFLSNQNLQVVPTSNSNKDERATLLHTRTPIIHANKLTVTDNMTTNSRLWQLACWHPTLLPAAAETANFSSCAESGQDYSTGGALLYNDTERRRCIQGQHTAQRSTL